MAKQRSWIRAARESNSLRHQLSQRLQLFPRSRPLCHPGTELGQHLDDADDQAASVRVQPAGDQVARLQEIHECAAFGGAAAGDGVEASLVRRREAAGSLGDISTIETLARSS